MKYKKKKKEFNGSFKKCVCGGEGEVIEKRTGGGGS